LTGRDLIREKQNNTTHKRRQKSRLWSWNLYCPCFSNIYL